MMTSFSKRSSINWLTFSQACGESYLLLDSLAISLSSYPMSCSIMFPSKTIGAGSTCCIINWLLSITVPRNTATRRTIPTRWFAALADDLVNKTTTLNHWSTELAFNLECVDEIPPAAIMAQATFPEQVDSDMDSRSARHASLQSGLDRITLTVPHTGLGSQGR
jgi:hypothetical protein